MTSSEFSLFFPNNLLRPRKILIGIASKCLGQAKFDQKFDENTRTIDDDLRFFFRHVIKSNFTHRHYVKKKEFSRQTSMTETNQKIARVF